jgi:hypothetical protein
MVLALFQGVSESHAYTGEEDGPSSSSAGDEPERMPGAAMMVYTGTTMMVEVAANADRLTGADPANTTAADRRKQAKKARHRLLSRLPIILDSAGQCRVVHRLSAPVMEVKTEYSHVASPIRIHAMWDLECASPQKLKHADIRLFATFPALESVAVIIVSEKTMATKLKPIYFDRSQTRVTF